MSYEFKAKYSRTEKLLLLVFSLVLMASSAGIINKFWQDSTDIFPSEGGEYVEASLGNVQTDGFTMNPLFTFGTKSNSVESDLSQLVFAGLMRYNPQTGNQEDFLATHTLSEDKKTYTFTLKNNLRWHDGAELNADDVIFTFKEIIQNPDFKNEFLKASFTDVEINKIDDKTVSFTIPKPYKFFLTNFTVGLVPRHILSTVPVKNLSIHNFNTEPIGAGPFKIENISSVDPRFDEISLASFQDFVNGKPKLTFITIRLYHNKADLIANLNELDGVRPMLATEEEFINNNDQFKHISFNIPHYLAVFINMNKDIFADEKGKKMRWALQLATNKDRILEKVPGKKVDTPLLEIDSSSWLSQYDKEKSAGALKDSGWFLPEKEKVVADIPSEEPEAPENIPEENIEISDAKYVYEPTKKTETNLITNDFFLVGSFPEGTQKVLVNNYQLNLFSPEKGRWTYKASTGIGTLKYGENSYTIKFLDEDGATLDTETVKINLFKEDELPAEAVKTEEKVIEEIKEEVVEEKIAEVVEKNTEPVFRKSEDGEELIVHILTPKSPAYFSEIADILKEEWQEVGIKTEIESVDMVNFVSRVGKRDYDLLLYGQNLGYNLDAFQYWHLSQAKVGLNLSEYQSFTASTLLAEIRRSHDEEKRMEDLKKLQEVMSDDVPAVFLLSPDYIFNVSPRLKNVDINQLALFPDRFAHVEKWYLHTEREFEEDKSWSSFFPWLIDKLF